MDSTIRHEHNARQMQLTRDTPITQNMKETHYVEHHHWTL